MTTPHDLEEIDLSTATRERPDYFAPDLYAEQTPAPERLGEQHRGQLRMAHRLAEAYEGRLMYVNGMDWHHWDGTRWAPDETAAAERAVHDVLRSALAESHDGDRNLRDDVRRCENAAGIRGVLDIAATLPGIRVPVSALDADPYLLNVANGTLDLRTRTLCQGPLSSAHRRPVFLPAGGHQNCPLVASWFARLGGGAGHRDGISSVA